MSRANRVDRNQAEIVALLRQVGATVQPLNEVKAGCPDLMVGYQGATYLLEVKDGTLPPSHRKLTPDQEKWHAAWNGGEIFIVTDITSTLLAIGVE